MTLHGDRDDHNTVGFNNLRQITVNRGLSTRGRSDVRSLDTVARQTNLWYYFFCYTAPCLGLGLFISPPSYNIVGKHLYTSLNDHVPTLHD